MTRMTDPHYQAFLLPAPLHTTPRYNTEKKTYSQMCSVCTLPVSLQITRDALVPIDGVRDGLEVAHSDCYSKRCDGCGAPWRTPCAHHTLEKNGRFV